MVRIRSADEVVLSLLSWFRTGPGCLEPKKIKGDEMFGSMLPPPDSPILYFGNPKDLLPPEPEEFEKGWDINIGSFLRMALEPGSVWTTKAPGGNGNNLVVRELVPEEKSVICDVEGQEGIMEIKQTVRNLITHYNPPSLSFEYHGPIEYGATCEKCNRKFEYQKKSAGFTCWACNNGY